MRQRPHGEMRPAKRKPRLTSGRVHASDMPPDKLVVYPKGSGVIVTQAEAKTAADAELTASLHTLFNGRARIGGRA